MNNSFMKRIRALEALLPKTRCPQCGDHPTQIRHRDADTDQVYKQSIPDDGCPGCGRMPLRVIDILFTLNEESRGS